MILHDDKNNEPKDKVLENTVTFQKIHLKNNEFSDFRNFMYFLLMPFFVL